MTAPAAALGDVLEGTFTARLATTETPSTVVVVTNGAFHVTRTDP